VRYVCANDAHARGRQRIVYTVKEGRRIFCIQCPRPDVVFMQYNIIRLRIRHIDISILSTSVYIT